jgi:hypothetical protein
MIVNQENFHRSTCSPKGSRAVAAGALSVFCRPFYRQRRSAPVRPAAGHSRRRGGPPARLRRVVALAGATLMHRLAIDSGVPDSRRPVPSTRSASSTPARGHLSLGSFLAMARRSRATPARADLSYAASGFAALDASLEGPT